VWVVGGGGTGDVDEIWKAAYGGHERFAG
jgi:hypothetical protein